MHVLYLMFCQRLLEAYTEGWFGVSSHLSALKTSVLSTLTTPVTHRHAYITLVYRVME